MRNCKEPPSSETLAELVMQALMTRGYDNEPVKVLVKYINQYGGDRKWLLLLLSTFNPDHEIFKPEYRKKRKMDEFAQMHNNYDGIYDNMP